MPRVGVIIPTHNRAHLLPRAIRSVLAQTFSDFEILVIDDASEDATPEVVAAFDDTRIRYLRHEVNRGESAARNTGIQNSSAPYIAFLDDDDEWLPDKLKLQVERMDGGPAKLGVVRTSCFRVRESDGKTIRILPIAESGDLRYRLKRRNCGGMPTVALVRRECFEKVGLFDESLRAFNDYDLWLRIAEEYWFDSIREPLAKYYVHDLRISRNPERLLAGVDRMLDKYRSLPMRRYLSRSTLFAAIAYCEAGERQKSRQAFFKTFRLAPFDARQYLIFVISMLGPRFLCAVRRLKHAAMPWSG
jgi:glycosyltransferase involved in cell wall biosynthesis